VTIRGGRFLEAPLVGTLQQQNDDCRTSIVLAAGDSSLYEDCLPCFGTFAKKTFFIGMCFCLIGIAAHVCMLIDGERLFVEL